MGTQTKDRYFLKLLIWFIFLSTLGVGGGIFFLLFAVVPIEQHFTDLGWSQFKIDSVMKYFVIGWVVFGMSVSFLYFFFVLKKNHWKSAGIGVGFTILLFTGGLYYFLNTGTGLVQSSQGEVVEGERFTFGPYPEEDLLKKLHEEGYDGIITLLNPALPIEKPLLDKETKSAEEVGLTVHSLPMLPWVGDNSGSIEKIKKLISQDNKRYYVHCYLGRHRVDVVKQVVNEELGETIDVRFLQPTTLERGSLFHFADKNILMGPYPTDEEWFTRIKRGGTEHIISLLKEGSDSKWIEKEQQTTTDSELTLTQIPLQSPVSSAEIRKVVDYARTLDQRVYIHNFNDPVPILMLQALISWDKTLEGPDDFSLSCGNPLWIGRKMMTGCTPSEQDRKLLSSVGVEKFVDASEIDSANLYTSVKHAVESKKLTYWIGKDALQQQQIARIAEGLLYGSLTRGVEFVDNKLKTGITTKHERNLLVGPMLTPAEYETFAQKNGIARIVYLHAASLQTNEDSFFVKETSEKAGIPLSQIDLEGDYADQLLPLLENEQGMTYIMTDASLIPQVNAYLKKY